MARRLAAPIPVGIFLAGAPTRCADAEAGGRMRELGPGAAARRCDLHRIERRDGRALRYEPA